MCAVKQVPLHMQNKEAFQQYFTLRDELDRHCAELSQLHESFMKCKAGCDQCCMDFSILPVEYFAIKHQAETLLQKGETPLCEGGCPFLVDHRCVIYPYRPFICRTQGLPLLFLNDEQWELSACELNFEDFDFDEFSEENTLPLDHFNSRLFALNMRFIESLPGKPYQPTDLIPLRNLFEN
jgi:uncharacterized protein